MEELLEEKNKIQFLINCLWSVANSDNDISDLEKEFIEKTGALLGLSPVEYKLVPDPELNSFEKAYYHSSVILSEAEPEAERSRKI